MIPDEVLLRDAASDLLGIFVDQGGKLSQVLCVVGPQTGATKLAEFMSDQIADFTSDGCLHASPEKTERDGQKSMDFNASELGILPGTSVLLCDDVLTTSGSVSLTADAVTQAGGIVMPFILVLVNRSSFEEVNGMTIPPA